MGLYRERRGTLCPKWTYIIPGSRFPSLDRTGAA